MDNNRDTWSEEELRIVYALYPKVKYAIHKQNILIIDLAAKLNKKARGVENQLLMFRAVEKEILENNTYGRKNYNKLIKEIYLESINTMDITNIPHTIQEICKNKRRCSKEIT